MQFAWLVWSYTTSSLLHGPHFYLKQDDALIGRLLHENPELMVMGSCVLVMLMKDEDVYIMNVGDSRAVVAQQHSKSWGSLSHVGHARTECAKVSGQNQVQTR
jgi:serine/threonine protein phosphatase PrpC